ncbi:MAG TPA: hypothetical protein VGH15_05220 [Caulobacteraceae bacterium]
MTRTLLAALAASVFVSASGVALAQTDPAAAPAASAAGIAAPPAKPVGNPDDKVVCKMLTPTGSRLGGHKVCMTKAQWQQQSDQARDTMNRSHPMDRPSG